MRLLLDTNLFLAHSQQTNPPTEDILSALDGAEQVFFSTASVWEIAIKYAKGALSFDVPLESAIQRGMRALQLTPLDVHQRHAFAAAALPPNHLDPFDRMLVAQAMAEGLTLVTTDRELALYDAEVIGVPKRRSKPKRS